MRLRSERIITPFGTIAGTVDIDGSEIRALTPKGTAPVSHDEVIHLGDRWLAPGFIDGHVHGGAGGQFNTTDPDEIDAVTRFHAQHGTTALLATTVAAAPDELTGALAAIARAAGRRPGGAELLGSHLEGPFLSRRRPGAMDPDCFCDPEPDTVTRLLTAAAGTLRQITLAPELPGARTLIAELFAQDVLVSVGHSDADYDAVKAAAEAGARSATHVFNAMAPLHHRRPGVVGAALDLPELNCELIADGLHVSAPAMRLVHRVKHSGGMRLVTDAMAAAGMPSGEYRLGASRVRVQDGRATLADGDSLAGSTLTMDAAVRNAVQLMEMSVTEAVTLASLSPARALGLSRKGIIAAGRDADLVVLDDGLQCVATMVGGTWVQPPPDAG